MNYGYLKLFLDWLPFLLFTGLLIYVMKGVFARQRRHFDSMTDYYSSHLEETRKMSVNLDRIASVLEKRDSSR